MIPEIFYQNVSVQCKKNSNIYSLGKFEEYRTLNVGQRVRVNFDVGKRIKLMQNHTGTHLLNCVLNKMFQFTRQKSR